MAKESQRQRLRERRKKRVQKQLARSTRPLLTMYRSDRHIYAQIVDPISGRTVAGVSTLSPTVREGLRSTKSRAAAAKVGVEIARLAREHQIDAVSFNRNGFVYAGRVKALADAAREAGLRI
jgi:large subunit ribosomal protein L18